MKEPLIADFKKASGWLETRSCWHSYASAMEGLNCVNQSWPIMLFKDVRSDFDNVVRSDAQEIAIECGVVQLAESQSVADKRLSFGL